MVLVAITAGAKSARPVGHKIVVLIFWMHTDRQSRRHPPLVWYRSTVHDAQAHWKRIRQIPRLNLNGTQVLFKPTGKDVTIVSGSAAAADA